MRESSSWTFLGAVGAVTKERKKFYSETKYMYMAKENLKSRKQYPTTVCFGLTHDDSTASSKRFSGS